MTPSVPASLQSLAYLSLQLIETITNAYDKKTRQNESYKMHRVLISKLDDLATDLRTTASSGAGAIHGHGVDLASMDPTADLGVFVKAIISSHKDAPQSLRYLWTGRPGQVRKKRKEKESFWSDGEKDKEDREQDRDIGGKDGRKADRDRERSDSSEDEDGSMAWSGRVQRKIEHWAA